MTRSDCIADAEILWEYMKLHEAPCDADVLLVLGSVDVRVAEYAASLTKRHTYGLVIFSGGVAHAEDALRTTWAEPEAEHFHTVFIQAGGRAKRALLEVASQNTGENARLSYELLRANGIAIPKAIELVTKPYMERRARATFDVQWPDHSTQIFVTSPQLSLHDYVNTTQPFDKLLTIMVGDFQRIVEYPKKGYQSAQPIPDSVRQAWERLVEFGYTNHLIE